MFVKRNVYALDSTTINLCHNVFCWASIRRAKGGIKKHKLLDIKTDIPVFMYITPGNVLDVNGPNQLTYEIRDYYIMYLGYIDFER